MLRQRFGRLIVRVLAGPDAAVAAIAFHVVASVAAGYLLGGTQDVAAAGAVLGAIAGLAAALTRLSSPFPPDQSFPLPTASELQRQGAFVLRTPGRHDANGLRATIDDDVVAANGWTPQLGRINSVLFRCPGVAAELGMLVVADPRTDVVLGATSIVPVADRECQVQIGGWIGPRARGAGLAALALRATAQVAFDHGAREVVAGTSIDNLAMRRSLETAGAHVSGEVRPHQLPDGTIAQSIWFAFDRT